MKNKINTIFTIGVLIFISMACNASFSTANLSELTFGKDKNATATSGTFKPEDQIFAISAVNNASGKNKAKFRVLFDKVDGSQSGSVAYNLENEMEVEGSRSFWFTIPDGLAPGSYKVELVLKDEDGKELDRKTGGFTVNSN